MIQRDFCTMKLPLLGLGMMRLPILNDDLGNIDEAKTKEMISYAMQQGVNYFDTAWGYHNGNSERVAGKLLAQYPRESYYLANKFPGYDLANLGKAKEIFEQQLDKCCVEYFDFYLIHNVCELNIDGYLDESLGIVKYFLEQRDAGKIKHLGFSAHGDYETIERFLKAYGKHMEFCQLQVNWLDWYLQDAKKKCALAASYELPLWVMEPLRGGKLATLLPEEEALLRELRPGESTPGWAYRFLQSIPRVTMVLTGASTLEQLNENIAAFEEEQPLNSKEMQALLKIAQGKLAESTVPCTDCQYCSSYCPQELSISTILKLYNQRLVTGKGDFIAPMALASLPEERQPGACTGCGSCEAVCPQQIKISEAMLDFAQLLKND